MKILKNAGTFKILTTIEELKNQMLRIEQAGRTCYQSGYKEITYDTASKFVDMLQRRRHDSVLEHSLMTVQFNNLSRGFTHEQVRHRLTSISQESTRYVDYAKPGSTEIDLEKFQLHCIVPPHQNENKKVVLEDGREMSISDMFCNVERFYQGLRKAGWPSEDARQILPIGIKSQIVISANFREWRHIFTLRTSKYAHWEIRGIMVKLLKEVQTILPIFDDFVLAGRDKNGLEYFEKRST